MKSSKRNEVSIEDIRNLVNKRWKPAENYEEFLKRAIEGKEKFFSAENISKKDEHGKITKIDREMRYNLSHIKMIFKKYPESFAYEETAEYIFDKYENMHVSMSSRYDVQLNYSKAVFKLMEQVATELNANILKDKERQDKLNAIKVKKQGYKYKLINKLIKNKFLQDKTVIETLINNTITKYLKEHGVETISDYMSFLNNKNKYVAFKMYCTRHKDAVIDFDDKIL